MHYYFGTVFIASFDYNRLQTQTLGGILMKNRSKLSTKKIVLTALLAALTTAGSAIRITLPLEIAGTTSFHLGNILCALSGILLGPWLGGVAA